MPPSSDSDRRHDDVVDRGLYDGSERTGNHDGNSKIENVPTHDERFEVLPHAGLLELVSKQGRACTNLARLGVWRQV